MAQGSEVAHQLEVLDLLVALLEDATGTQGLLIAASLFRLTFCISRACNAPGDNNQSTARQHTPAWCTVVEVVLCRCIYNHDAVEALLECIILQQCNTSMYL